MSLTVSSYEQETYFSDNESSPTNKFSEIYDISSGRDGTTFKILIEKQKYYALFDTGAEISVMTNFMTPTY